MKKADVRSIIVKKFRPTSSKVKLDNAYHTQQPGNGLIFHSDLGTQYTSDEFANVIDK